MKALVNTTVLVYMAQAMPEFLSGAGAATIREVASELRHIVGEAEAGAVLSSIEVLRARKTRLAFDGGKWLSETDRLLLSSAKATGSILVTDDRKLLACAKENGCACKDTPHFAESLNGRIDRQTAVGFLQKLRPLYLRRKVVDAALERVSRW